MTKVYSITYDLVKERDYHRLFEEIKQVAIDYTRATKSQWFISSNLDSEEICHKLGNVVDKDDKLLVLEIEPSNWASYGIDRQVTSWLKQYNK